METRSSSYSKSAASSTNYQLTAKTEYYADAAAELNRSARSLREAERLRDLEFERGTKILAGICFFCVVVGTEPNTLKWFRSTPVGSFFTQVKIEIPATTTKEEREKPKPANNKLVPPLPSTAVITSRFGKRFHPVNNVWGPHFGIDISQALGAPVVAISDGKVIDVENSCVIGNRGCGGQFGNLVKIDHGNGFTSLYGHLTQARVEVGQQVKAGQVIGSEGTTGNSSGTHLHLQLEQDDKPFDPEQKFPNTWEVYERYDPTKDGLPF